jgi:hypothetical protein
MQFMGNRWLHNHPALIHLEAAKKAEAGQK